jgi:hypothetical protein
MENHWGVTVTTRGHRGATPGREHVDRGVAVERDD